MKEQRIGPYWIERLLGQGGMGEVYLARREDGSSYALKLLRNDGFLDEDAVARFQLEGQTLRLLRHPHVVNVHEVGVCPQGHYLVMDLLTGEPLDERLKRGPLDPDEARRIMIAVGDAVAYAHRNQLLHRDLKPANVIMNGEVPVLTDFGLVRRLDARQQLTRTGEILGTPAFMSPEQCGLGAEVGPGADVYGLGATLFALLTTRAPFDGVNAITILDRVVHERAPTVGAVRAAPVPADLEAAVARCLAKRPEDRFPSAEAFVEALRAREAPVRDSAPQRSPLNLVIAGLALIALALAALVGALLAQSQPEPLGQASATPTLAPPGVPQGLGPIPQLVTRAFEARRAADPLGALDLVEEAFREVNVIDPGRALAEWEELWAQAHRLCAALEGKELRVYRARTLDMRFAGVLRSLGRLREARALLRRCFEHFSTAPPPPDSPYHPTLTAETFVALQQCAEPYDTERALAALEFAERARSRRGAGGWSHFVYAYTLFLSDPTHQGDMRPIARSLEQALRQVDTHPTWTREVWSDALEHALEALAQRSQGRQRRKHRKRLGELLDAPLPAAAALRRQRLSRRHIEALREASPETRRAANADFYPQLLSDHPELVPALSGALNDKGKRDPARFAPLVDRALALLRARPEPFHRPHASLTALRVYLERLSGEAGADERALTILRESLRARSSDAGQGLLAILSCELGDDATSRAILARLEARLAGLPSATRLDQLRRDRLDRILTFVELRRRLELDPESVARSPGQALSELGRAPDEPWLNRQVRLACVLVGGYALAPERCPPDATIGPPAADAEGVQRWLAGWDLLARHLPSGIDDYKRLYLRSRPKTTPLITDNLLGAGSAYWPHRFSRIPVQSLRALEAIAFKEGRYLCSLRLLLGRKARDPALDTQLWKKRLLDFETVWTLPLGATAERLLQVRMVQRYGGDKPQAKRKGKEEAEEEEPDTGPKRIGDAVFTREEFGALRAFVKEWPESLAQINRGLVVEPGPKRTAIRALAKVSAGAATQVEDRLPETLRTLGLEAFTRSRPASPASFAFLLVGERLLAARPGVEAVLSGPLRLRLHAALARGWSLFGFAERALLHLEAFAKSEQFGIEPRLHRVELLAALGRIAEAKERFVALDEKDYVKAKGMLEARYRQTAAALSR